MDKGDNYTIISDQSALRKKVTCAVGTFVAIFLCGLGAGVIVQEVNHNNEVGHNSLFKVSGDVGSCYGIHLSSSSGNIVDSSVCPGATSAQFLAETLPTSVKFDIPASQCFSSVTYSTDKTLDGFKGPSSITVKSAWLSSKLTAANATNFAACKTKSASDGISMTVAASFTLDITALKGATGATDKDNTTIINSINF
ncbi:hypothetical protein THRCLA_20217 [Thraustotheca clavata]|uniref:Uncharacterized protein n=1 Tax=Thraustotheca clavata TaxID=74557 RepID=A0A1W0AAC4_9STRA|nr:hypothetical protein THRCLA_20217 [Thraustotheca clavata]